MTRQQLINVVLPLIIQDTKDRATADRIIEMKTTSELGILYARFIREGRVQPPTPAVTHAEVEAERIKGEQELQRLRDELEMDQALAVEARIMEAEKFRKQQYLDQEPQRKAEAEAVLARDRAAFGDAAKLLCSFTPNSEANFNLCRQVLGEGNVSIHLISEGIASGALQLSQITQTELNEYRAEDVSRRNADLKAMDIPTLKAEVRRESTERAKHHHEQETDRVLAAQQQADSYVGFPEMPLVNSDGVKLDSLFFRRATAATIRVYLRRYGNAQITNAIRNRN
jgi:hypothetical protein